MTAMGTDRVTELSASLVDISHVDGVRSISLAEDERLGWVLEFQHADEFDQQDKALGFDTYCIVSGMQEGTTYGGVEIWWVRSDTLFLVLTPEAARELGLTRDVRVQLAFESDVRRLIVEMTSILGMQPGEPG
jgi:hypothetical protein